MNQCRVSHRQFCLSIATVSQVLLGWASISWASDAGDAVQMYTFQTHSRVSIRIDDSVPVQFQNSNRGFQILLKGIGFADLGAPMGEESRWKSLYQGLGDSLAGLFQFSENSDGVVISGQWKFPVGKQALADPAMESFVYRQKSPPRYVIDFWLKKGPTQLEAEASRKESQHIASLQKTREEAQKHIDRRIAYEKYRAEVANVSSFCEKPVNESNNIFLEFRALHEGFNFRKWLLRTTADQDFHYFKPKASEKDAQYVRLALDLYAKENPGLAVRTLDFLKEEFPKSPYLLQMEFLRANCLIKLGLQSAGEEILSQLITTSRTSPVALHSVMYLVGRQMGAGETHQALQHFLWLAQNYPHHELNWLFHLGVAECLYAQGEADRAAQEYRWVIAHAPHGSKKAEAAYRLGDVYQRTHQYSQSLASYYAALQSFSSDSKRFPSFYLNRGETLYQLKQFDHAQEVFLKFLEEFSGHPQGWRATLRLGEIAGRKSQQSERAAQQKWYYETINRFPLSSGATVARLRLLPCGDHGGFDVKSAMRFLHQVQNFDGAGEIFPKGYADLRALSRIRALITMGTQDETALGAIDELQYVQSPAVRQTLATIANDFFQKMIMRLLDEGHAYEALSYYSAVAPKIPNAETVTDIDYLLRLSQSAADLGLGSFASNLYEAYAKKLENKKNSARSPSSINTMDQENTQFESELRSSEKFFTEAKALYISQLEQSSPDYTKVKEMLLHVKDESKFSTLKEMMLGLVAQKEGKVEESIQHLTQVQLTSTYLNVDYFLAKIEEKRGNLEVSRKILENLEKRLILRQSEKVTIGAENSAHQNEALSLALGLPEIPDLKTVLHSIAEISEKQQDWTRLTAVYERALRYDIQSPMFQYSYAQALFKQGDAEENSILTEKAQKVLEDLVQRDLKEGSNAAASGDPEKLKFWKALASENLANAKSIGKFIATAKEGMK